MAYGPDPVTRTLSTSRSTETGGNCGTLENLSDACWPAALELFDLTRRASVDSLLNRYTIPAIRPMAARQQLRRTQAYFQSLFTELSTALHTGFGRIGTVDKRVDKPAHRLPEIG